MGDAFSVPRAIGQLDVDSAARAQGRSLVWDEFDGIHVYAQAGTVTSVGMDFPTDVFIIGGSPVTTFGIITMGLAYQAANTFLAGPVSGANFRPAFRLLDPADLPPIVTGSGAPSTTPAAGALYFDTAGAYLYCYTGTAWKKVLLT